MAEHDRLITGGCSRRFQEGAPALPMEWPAEAATTDVLRELDLPQPLVGDRVHPRSIRSVGDHLLDAVPVPL